MSLSSEKSFYERRVRPAFHRPPYAVCWKVQDSFNRGLPDIDVCVEGETAKIELKYVKAWPARKTTPIRVNLSAEQARRLGEWTKAGGQAYVLLGVEDDWFLLPPTAADKYSQDGLREAALASGSGRDLRDAVNYIRGIF